MSQPTFDVAHHEIWYTDGGSGFYALQVTNDVWPGGKAAPPAGAPQPSCPLASGRLAGRSLGPVSLGMTRHRARRAFSRSATHGRRNMDFFCLTPIGIRVAYPSAPVLRALSRSARKRDRGKVVLALTSNRYYALHGVRPHARLARISRRLHLGRSFHIGKNFWYVSKVGAPRAIVKVRHGEVQEIGILDKSVSSSRQAQRRLLNSLR
jgi:hypothetical protein